MLDFQFQTWSLHELWITLISQRAEYQTNLGLQSDLCPNFLWWEHAWLLYLQSSPPAPFSPTNNNLQNSLLKGAPVSTVGTGKHTTFPVFSPSWACQHLLLHLELSQGLNVRPRKSKTENHPPNHHLFSAEIVSAVVHWGASRNLRRVNFRTCWSSEHAVCNGDNVGG